ncbi:hypothetical protein GWI33_009026 [Rhynchophorus ferrugineus]|uniref:Uncharacterized protein n=1 Tax=Rhynchophorus ferrugineus TaxID=354439 RepID=A0A834IB38_RHYFE|nr:hypothetical protein GWI33_009026 [Rhynchophorus ferrugineus]
MPRITAFPVRPPLSPNGVAPPPAAACSWKIFLETYFLVRAPGTEQSGGATAASVRRSVTFARLERSRQRIFHLNVPET